jgi:hypothetical protein
LLDHAAVIGPELLEREDEILQVHDVADEGAGTLPI